MQNQMRTMPITSDVIGKLHKIQNGTVFDSPLVFVVEMMQNAYRARAKTMRVTMQDDTLVFADDGCGAGSPKTILTLDYSQWASTTEGFGIGFWSVLAIPDIRECRVTSRKWSAVINVAALFTNGTPEATVTWNNDLHHGFRVQITAPYIRDHRQEIIDEVMRIGALQPYVVTINECPVPRQDLFDNVGGEFTNEFSTRLFTARLAVTTHGWHTPDLYYERRSVCDYHDIMGVRGIIEMKPGALTLKEPDRKQIVVDDKRRKFADMLLKCNRDLYREFVRQATTDQIARYAETIDEILSVGDYEAYVLDDAMFMSIGGMTSVSDRPEQIAFERTEIDPDTFTRDDEEVVSPGVGTLSHRSTKPRKRSVRSEIKKWKRTVWINADEMDGLQEIVAKAKYYGLTVVTARNVLQKNVFVKYQVPHISEIEKNIVRRHVIANVMVRTRKEEAFLALLSPICQYYNIPNVFRIGNITMTLEVSVGGRVIDRERKQVGGLVHDGLIVLDRKHLALKRFHLYGRGFGQHELKTLLATLPTVCHELAHLLYHTTDNTTEHFNTERRIYDELVTMYLR